MTCYPKQEFIDALGSHYSDEEVVVSDKFITASAPGTSYKWAFKMIEIFVSLEKAKAIDKATFYNFYSK